MSQLTWAIKRLATKKFTCQVRSVFVFKGRCPACPPCRATSILRQSPFCKYLVAWKSRIEFAKVPEKLKQPRVMNISNQTIGELCQFDFLDKVVPLSMRKNSCCSPRDWKFILTTLPWSLIWNFKMSLWDFIRNSLFWGGRNFHRSQLPAFQLCCSEVPKKNKWWTKLVDLTHVACDSSFARPMLKYLFATCVHPSLRLSRDEREKRHFACLCIYTYHMYVYIYYIFYLTVFVLFHINLTIFSSKQIRVHAIKTTHF